MEEFLNDPLFNADEDMLAGDDGSIGSDDLDADSAADDSDDDTEEEAMDFEPEDEY